MLKLEGANHYVIGNGVISSVSYVPAVSQPSLAVQTNRTVSHSPAFRRYIHVSDVLPEILFYLVLPR